MRSVALALTLLAVGATGTLARGADTSVRSKVLSALRERDDTERARALEDALRGARGADAARLVARTALPRADSERDRAICVAALGRMESDEAVRRTAAQARSRKADAAVRASLATALALPYWASTGELVRSHGKSWPMRPVLKDIELALSSLEHRTTRSTLTR